MPFGLTNAPATFQHMMNDILRDFIDRCAMVYLDDIIVFLRYDKKHVANVLAVVQVLQKEGLVLNEEKREGIRPNPDKICAFLKWPSCSTITEEVGPLYKLLEGSPRKGSPISWGEEFTRYRCIRQLYRGRVATKSGRLAELVLATTSNYRG